MQGAHLYVSGSADKMPQQVATALEDVLIEHAAMSRPDAKVTLKQLEQAGRYTVEAWS